jgi:hypothetical protein
MALMHVVAGGRRQAERVSFDSHSCLGHRRSFAHAAVGAVPRHRGGLGSALRQAQVRPRRMRWILRPGLTVPSPQRAQAGSSPLGHRAERQGWQHAHHLLEGGVRTPHRAGGAPGPLRPAAQSSCARDLAEGRRDGFYVVRIVVVMYGNMVKKIVRTNNHTASVRSGDVVGR